MQNTHLEINLSRLSFCLGVSTCLFISPLLLIYPLVSPLPLRGAEERGEWDLRFRFLKSISIFVELSKL